MKINTFCGHSRPRLQRYAGGEAIKKTIKPSQLDPLPVIIGASSQQRIWGKKNPEFWTKMRY